MQNPTQKTRQFVNGVKISMINTQYGTLVKLYGHTKEFCKSLQDAEKKEDGTFNVVIKQGKSGTYYMESDDFVPVKKQGDLPYTPTEEDNLPF